MPYRVPSWAPAVTRCGIAVCTIGRTSSKPNRTNRNEYGPERVEHAYRARAEPLDVEPKPHRVDVEPEPVRNRTRTYRVLVCLVDVERAGSGYTCECQYPLEKAVWL